MGRAKELLLEQWEQGWSFSPGVYICHNCLSDPELARYAQEHASSNTCSFCDRVTRQRPISIEFDSLMEIVMSALKQYYDRAVDELGYCSAEGGYLGTTYDSYDIIRDESPFCEISENDRVLSRIVECLEDEVWCDKSPYSIIGFEAYRSSWDQFCSAVKHRTRYFFTRRSPRERDSELTPVSQMLDELSSNIETEGLIHQLPTNTNLFRVRVHRTHERCDNRESLGPPPPSVAPSNRMSPAGVSMFYGSADLTTAKTEALSTLGKKRDAALTAAIWNATRPVLLLNLCGIRQTPSFWFSSRSERDRVLFLHEFAASISQPVIHDGREHIEYVPSQIVTEYFRDVYRTHEGSQLDGIFFPSARARGGKNMVIFVSPEDLTPVSERGYGSPPLLVLNPSSIKRLRKRPCQVVSAS